MTAALLGATSPEAGVDTEALGVQGTCPGLLPLHLLSPQEGLPNPPPPTDAVHILEPICGTLCLLQDETRKDSLRSCASCSQAGSCLPRVTAETHHQ